MLTRQSYSVIFCLFLFFSPSQVDGLIAGNYGFQEISGDNLGLHSNDDHSNQGTDKRSIGLFSFPFFFPVYRKILVSSLHLGMMKYPGIFSLLKKKANLFILALNKLFCVYQQVEIPSKQASKQTHDSFKCTVQKKNTISSCTAFLFSTL